MMKTQDHDAVPFLQGNQLPLNFCLVPFTTLTLNPNGDVGCCRELTTRHVLGNLHHQTLEEIWNGPEIRSWRREFLNGKIKTCKEQIRHRACNLVPNRNNEHLLNASHMSEFQEKKVPRLGAGLNGRCNLRCNMCDLDFDYNGLFDKLNLWQEMGKHIFPYLQEIDFLSGEPFIQKDTFKLIDLITPINSKCQWYFTTNANWAFTSQVKTSLNKIQNLRLNISLDSLNDQTYPLIRKHGNLKQALKTTKDLLRYINERKVKNKLSRLGINMTVQRLNWREVPRFFKFAQEMGISCWDAGVQEVEQWPELSLCTLPESDKRNILDFYLSEMEPIHFSRAREVITPIIESLSPKQRIAYKLVILDRFEKKTIDSSNHQKAEAERCYH